MRARRTDKAHAAVLDAIRALGLPCMSLHAAGNGLEDIIVGTTSRVVTYSARNEYEADEYATRRTWLMVEVKTPNKSGGVKPSKFTPAQREWYALTQGFPRLVVTSAQDAIDKLRRMVQ